MKINGDNVTLSTGTCFYANRGIIGINSDLKLFEGYDGTIDTYEENKFTKEEKIELADHMIDLWTRYKDG